MSVKRETRDDGSGKARAARPFPTVIAHRGNAREFPENTIASLRSAIQIGIDFLAFDVQLAGDEVPVVIHDESLVRTAGLPKSVFELTGRELRRTEAAERARFEDRFSDIRIPTLEQCTELLAAHPEVTAFVALKRASLRQFGSAVVVSRVMETLRPVREQCVPISTDLPTMQACRRAGAIAVGWELDEYDEHSRLKYEALRPDYLFCERTQLPRADRLWRGPWHWAVSDVDQVADALALAERGAAFVQTMAVRPLLRGLSALPAAPQ
ncbi:MAG: glycerophosphodiester phosphodiesterase [Proteobacteria bacterium]|nr:glycerophosphodiester phosphodiesterase [Pseudomonadota bacterium]